MYYSTRYTAKGLTVRSFRMAAGKFLEPRIIVGDSGGDERSCCTLRIGVDDSVRSTVV